MAGLRASVLALILTVGAACPATPISEYERTAYRMSNLIARYEGFGKQATLPTRLHNPGALRRKDGRFMRFRDDEAGWLALRRHLAKRLISGRSPRQIMQTYCKPRNDRYVEYVLKGLTQ